MGVLCVMPTWNAPSELWLQRMLAGIEEHLVAVAAYHPTERFWRGHVPVIPLDAPWSLGWRAARKLGLRSVPNLRLRRALRSRRLHAVLVNYVTVAAQLEGALRSARCPVFVHCHGYDVTFDLRSHEDPKSRCYGPDYVETVQRIAQRATLIANSRTVAGRLAAIGIPPDRIVTKYLGVPVPDAAPPPRPARRDVTVLYLGRLVDCKAPDLTIRAFEQACALGMDGRLVVAGDGPLRMTCELIARHSRYSDRIQLLGAVDGETGAQLFREADIFTAHNCLGPLTHQEEALGVSVLEAMAAGLPVVSGLSGGLAETVDDGVTGILVAPGDVEAHARALLALARDPALRNAMGMAGWRRVKEQFSAEKDSAELLRIMGIAG